MSIGTRKVEIVGKTFGRLLVLSEAEPVIVYNKKGWKQTIRMVNCLCSCGEVTLTQLFHLKRGASKSCGCSKVKHLLSEHPLYGVWADMKKRCNNENHVFFHRYGGRGICYDERWAEFENFYSDMSAGYKKGMKLERVNNDGNYELSNCKWDTQKNQTNNTCNTVWVDYNGEKRPLTLICEELGLKYHTIWNRIKKMNLTFQESINYVRVLKNTSK